MGSIPAWAGETSRPKRPKPLGRVYPRVGGGNPTSPPTTPRTLGLSPRGRGKRSLLIHRPQRRRSIPAWAGETHQAVGCAIHTAVYPRVGGGNWQNRSRMSTGDGLSPRGRGKRYVGPCRAIAVRSIPAWAGETRPPPGPEQPTPVYPRVGGGNDNGFAQNLGTQGLSPRGRGKPGRSQSQRGNHLSIPAWAGETLERWVLDNPPQVYPRVGGGNLFSLRAMSAISGLSPRGRGKRGPGPRSGAPARSIPAWAGETARAACIWPRYQVYPRVGGRNRAITLHQHQDEGLSPRGRGKRPAPPTW